MGHIDDVKSFLLDDKIRVSHKAAIIICVMFSFIAVDNIFGLSYYFNIDRKLTHLETLDKIILNPKSDSTTVVFTKKIKSEILNRNNILDYFSDLTIDMYSIIKKKEPTIQTDNTTEVNIGFDFWFHLTSGGVFYIFAFLLSPVVLLTNPIIPFIQRSANSILTFAMLFMFGYMFYKICSFIPHFEIKIFTYIINITVQILALIIIINIINKNNKQSA